MADKIFPASKPPTTTTVNPTPTATKPHIHNTARPVYRSHPHRNNRRSCYCYCYCCLWIIFILIISAIFTAVLYLLYRPHPPSFTVSNLHISQFNITSSNHLTTRFNLTVTARNPNNKMTFYYDPVSVTVSSDGVEIGDGLVAAFVAGKRSTTSLKAVVRGELKEKEESWGLKIEMNAKVKVKIGRFESKKAHVRVVCDGVKVVDGGGSAVVVTKNNECEVDLRIRIWKWTF